MDTVLFGGAEMCGEAVFVMIVRVVRQGETFVIVLPKEVPGIGNGAELELIEVKPGIFSLISPDALSPVARKEEAPVVPPAVLQARPALKVSEEELKLLKKMAAMSMESRTVKGMGLDGREQMLLNALKGRDLIFFSSKKYPKGVYGLSQEAYLLATADSQRHAPLAPVPRAVPPEKNREQASLSWEEHLVKYGYVVIENEGEAREASARLEKELREGTVLGTRGFDKKYYVAQKGFYGEWGLKVRKLLKEAGPSGIDAVAGKLSMSEVAARVELELMREQGELIEKKKGLYALV
ncbi:Uncharacterised protein [uncultured archaeon]|nr:Uncharacterised protein [uncultured archaeon]